MDTGSGFFPCALTREDCILKKWITAIRVPGSIPGYAAMKKELTASIIVFILGLALIIGGIMEAHRQYCNHEKPEHRQEVHMEKK